MRYLVPGMKRTKRHMLHSGPKVRGLCQLVSRDPQMTKKSVLSMNYPMSGKLILRSSRTLNRLIHGTGIPDLTVRMTSLLIIGVGRVEPNASACRLANVVNSFAALACGTITVILDLSIVVNVGQRS